MPRREQFASTAPDSLHLNGRVLYVARYSTLYVVAMMIAAMLGAMLMFFGRQENIPALKWWGTAYLLGAVSVALWTLASDCSADAFAGAECGRLPGLRHGVERVARVPRP